MRKSYIRGNKVLILIGLIMMIVSLGSVNYTVEHFKDVKTLYQEGEKFEGQSGYSVIKVLGIEETKIEDESLGENQKYYIIETELNYVFLKSTREDLKNVIGDRLGEDGKLRKFTSEELYARIDAIPEKTRRRRSTKINVTPELKDKFRNAINDSFLLMFNIKDSLKKNSDKDKAVEEIKKRPCYTYTYIEPSGNGYYIFNVGLSSIFSIVTLLIIFSIIRRIRRAKSSYENMFITYPEVERDLDILLKEASYIDEDLKVIVYKNSIIVYKGIFIFETFDNIGKVRFDKLVEKRRVTGYMVSIDDTFGEVVFKSNLGKSKKDTCKKVRELGIYLQKNHQVKVSYNI